MSLHPDIVTLRSPRSIRTRAAQLLVRGLEGRLEHFYVLPEALDGVAELVAFTTRERFPDLAVPTHGRMLHFDAGGVPRAANLRARLSALSALERARALTDVVVVSVLLDAGAGMAWRYREASGLELARSEGLAVASLDWLAQGALSSHGTPYEVDAAGLSSVSEGALAAAFQVGPDNPLVGVGGRVHLLRELGKALAARTDVFGADARIGGFVDALARAHPSGAVEAEHVLLGLLDALAPIWPGRLSLHGVPLGDVWRHPHISGDGETDGLMPFHKLSQWLTYSLFEPLSEAGLQITESDELTGLAEYRNGGLFVDMGVLVPRNPALLGEPQAPDATSIVEWRALTVALIDCLLPLVRTKLGAPELPLASMLEGGTWTTGRIVARTKRADGGPPIQIVSDGTVF